MICFDSVLSDLALDLLFTDKIFCIECKFVYIAASA